MLSAAWECLHRATLDLATSEPLKHRLTDAFSRHLLELDPALLPADLREDFQMLRERMTAARPYCGESRVAATVKKMSTDEADACAAQIVALLDGLHRAADASPEEAATGKNGGDQTTRRRTLVSVNRV